MASPSMGLGAPLFLAVWLAMTIAMMFPAAAPMALTFHKAQSARRKRRQAFVETWVFLSGYLVVWVASGVVAYVGALAAEAIATRLDLSTQTSARIGAVHSCRRGPLPTDAVEGSLPDQVPHAD